MSGIADERPLFDLILPGTHNSATYKTKHSLMGVRKFVTCQDASIYDQLRMGVRFLDLRLVVAVSKERALWCGHSFLTVPLDEVVGEVRRFLSENRKECVVIKVQKDYSPVKAPGGCDLEKPSPAELAEIFEKKLPEETVPHAVAKTTPIGELRGRVVGFINGQQYIRGVE
jgi:hypothetical protein